MTRPRFVRAPDAVVAPVPPTFIARVEVERIPVPPFPSSISPVARVLCPVPPCATARSVPRVRAPVTFNVPTIVEDA